MNKSWIPVVIATTLVERFLDLISLVLILAVLDINIVTQPVAIQLFFIISFFLGLNFLLNGIRKRRTELINKNNLVNSLILTRLAVLKLIKCAADRKVIFLSIILWIPYIFAAKQIADIEKIDLKYAVEMFTLTLIPLSWLLNQREWILAVLSLIPVTFLYLRYRRDKSYVENLNLISPQLIVENESSNRELGNSFLAFATDEKILRVFQGGSGALTLLVKDRRNDFIVRKVAWGKDEAETLRNQFQYINESRNSYFPFVEKRLDSTLAFCYEMEYLENFTNLENVVHSNLDIDWGNLLSHYENAFPETGINVDVNHRDFIEDKMQKLRSETAKILKSNGRSEILIQIDQSLKYFANYAKKVDYSPPFYKTHGDLSTTNIMLNKESLVKFIDVSNKHGIASRSMDIGKLYFSLNSGYEAFNQGLGTFTHGDETELLQVQSLRSKEAAEKLKRVLVSRYGLETFLEIQFYSIVHCWRVIPYRFRNDKGKELGWCLFYLDYAKRLKDEINLH
jgi:hypothetical protein